METQKRKYTLFTAKQLLWLVLPIVIEQIFSTSLGFFDSLMVSNMDAAQAVRSNASNAIGNVDYINNLIIQLFSAFATGGAIVTSQALGAGDRERANKVAKQLLMLVICVSLGVGCVNDVAKALARENQDLVSGTIDGLYTFPHPFGCSQTGHDHAQTRKLLAALARHPNAGAVLVLSLGCENLTHEQFLAELGDYDPERVKFLTCQEVSDEMAAGRELLEECAAYAGRSKREETPVSELVVGMKCGGSDGLSGITANPTVGRFSDTLCAMGGATVLTEVPEMFGAENFLMDRCVDEAVFEKAAGMLNGFKDYFISHNEVVYDNPSPGNKQGGITTLEDKSCGCVQKGGSAPIVDVIGYGDAVTKKGLNLLYGPGNDLVSATALTAAGAHLILFTTGRGTPFGAPAPTMKIATNTPLATKKSGWIDFNAGVVADGERTIGEAAADLMDLVCEVASGRRTRAEEKGFREISIFKDGVVL